MGLDIWAFVEYGFDSGGYGALFQGPILLPRNYPIFEALAGIRNREPPLYPARGLPTDLGSATFERYYEYVIDEKDTEIYNGFQAITINKLTDAERSTLLPPDQGRGMMKTKYGYRPYPDFLAPSWLEYDEVIRALEHHGIDLNEIPLEYQVTLDVMASIRKRGLSKTSRLVFWFSG